jgi:16S rRNA (uracil1498-N3)-methyltransferase
MNHHDSFYVTPENITRGDVVIEGPEFRHLITVMRKKIGDFIQIVDGTGNLFTVRIAEITRHTATCTIQQKSRFHNEPTFHLSLASGIPKSGRYDWIIEKGTELGVSVFYPLISERSVNKGSDNKIARWRNLAIAAMKQSTRCVLPEIHDPQTVQELLARPTIYDYQLIAHPGAGVKNLTQVILQLKKDVSTITSIKKGIILIGPEGGFSESELNFIRSLNYHQFTLGERRLRTETAAISAAAIVMELVNNASVNDF